MLANKSLAHGDGKARFDEPIHIDESDQPTRRRANEGRKKFKRLHFPVGERKASGEFFSLLS